MPAAARLDVILNAQDKVTKVLQNVDKSLNKTRRAAADMQREVTGPGAKIQKSISDMRTAWAGVAKKAALASGGILAVGMAGKKLFDLAQSGAAINDQFALLIKQGVDVKRIMAEATDATAGTIAQEDLIKSLAQFKSFGLDVEKFGATMAGVSKAAIATGQNAGFLLDKMVTGLAKGSLMRLDDLSIKINGIGEVNAFAAKMFDKSADSITAAERSAALHTLALEKLAVVTDGVNLKTDSQASAMQRITIAFTDMWTSVKRGLADDAGRLLAFFDAVSGKSDDVADGVGSVTAEIEGQFATATSALKDWAAANPWEAIKAGVSSLDEIFVVATGGITEGDAATRRAADSLMEYADGVEGLRPIVDALIGEIMEGSGVTIEAAAAMDGLGDSVVGAMLRVEEANDADEIGQLGAEIVGQMTAAQAAVNRFETSVANMKTEITSLMQAMKMLGMPTGFLPEDGKAWKPPKRRGRKRKTTEEKAAEEQKDMNEIADAIERASVAAEIYEEGWRYATEHQALAHELAMAGNEEDRLKIQYKMRQAEAQHMVNQAVARGVDIAREQAYQAQETANAYELMTKRLADAQWDKTMAEMSAVASEMGSVNRQAGAVATAGVDLTKVWGAYSKGQMKVQDATSATIGTLGQAAGAFIEDQQAMAIIGSLFQVAEAAAAFASQNYVKGGMHLAAAALYAVVAATTPSAGGGGGGGGGVSSPGAMGFDTAGSRDEEDGGRQVIIQFGSGVVLGRPQDVALAIAAAQASASGTGMGSGSGV